MSLYTDIAWGRRTKLSQDELNKRQKIIADAIEALRAFVPDWEAQVAALNAVGLERINEALLPAYQQIIEVSNLGALFSASSESSVEIGLGTKVFVIDESQRLNFAPTPYLMAYADGDFETAVFGELVSYDMNVGVVTIDVRSIKGSGTFSSWTIGPLATSDDFEDFRQAVIEVAEKHAQVLAVGALYYGARNTPPTGATLGAQYLDTSVTPNLTKVLTSTGWAPTVTVSVGGRRTQDYTAATSGMTGPFAVDGGFSTGDVYVNGVLMRAPAEVTLSPGPTGSFSLVEPLSAGDLVSFRGFLANDATDIYTKSEIDGSRVRFDAPQGLSNAQKGQARANIGFSSEEDPIASEAQARDGTNNTELMTPLRTHQAIDETVNSLLGNAPGEKSFWLTCGTSGNIIAQRGVSSITDDGEGRLTVSLSVTFAGLNTYVVHVDFFDASPTTGQVRSGSVGAMTATSFSAKCVNASGTIIDPVRWMISGNGV